MSNLEDHEAEQARITAECEAGECDHSECRDDDIEARIDALTLESLSLEDRSLSTAHRGARLIASLNATFDACDSPEGVIRDALIDLRHACDLCGLSFADIDRQAHNTYTSERAAAHRFTVSLRETTEYRVEVEAETPEQAQRSAQEFMEVDLISQIAVFEKGRTGIIAYDAQPLTKRAASTAGSDD